MNVITPFDLVSMFPESRSLIVVGNAPSLCGSSLGEWIDSHDVVVRFNACALAGFEKDVGARTDILVTNPYPEARTRDALDGGQCKLVIVISRQTRRGDRAAFERWIGHRDVLFTYTPDLLGGPALAHSAGATTGVYAIGLLSRVLKPSMLSVTGFTCFQDDTAHYWSDVTPPGVASHDMTGDARLLLALLRVRKVKLTVTSELIWLARKLGCEPLVGAIIKPLPDTRWQA